MRYLLRKGKGADDIRRELAFFRNNRRRMEHADAAAAGYAIGSGAVESANKVLVTVRMKLRAALGTRRRPRGPDLPVASQVRALRPGVGRRGAASEPLRRLEAAPMRQRQPARGAGRARRVIRQKNIRESKGEPYENRTRPARARCAGVAMVREAFRELAGHTEHVVGLPQEQRAAVRRKPPAVEARRHLTATVALKNNRIAVTPCAHGIRPPGACNLLTKLQISRRAVPCQPYW